MTHAICDVGILTCSACAEIHATTLTRQPDEEGPQLLASAAHKIFVHDLRQEGITMHDLLMVRAVGNAAANDVLEAGSAGMIERRPDEDGWRERFILQKYIQEDRTR